MIEAKDVFQSPMEVRSFPGPNAFEFNATSLGWQPESELPLHWIKDSMHGLKIDLNTAILTHAYR